MVRGTTFPRATSQLDYEPARFLCRRLVRRKYVRRADPDAVPVVAPLPEGLQVRCIAAPGLIAQIAVPKFCDHLPLYRQERIYKTRHDVWLPRQRQARWLGLAADWLRPIYESIRTGVLAGGYMQVDETPIEYLSPGNGSTRQGYLWSYNRPGGDVFFDWQTSRAASCLENVVRADFDGTIQCDAYSAYTAFAKRRPITLAGCWVRQPPDAPQVPRSARGASPHGGLDPAPDRPSLPGRGRSTESEGGSRAA